MQERGLQARQVQCSRSSRRSTAGDTPSLPLGWPAAAGAAAQSFLPLPQFGKTVCGGPLLLRLPGSWGCRRAPEPAA
jgi:hypothetical protein